MRILLLPVALLVSCAGPTPAVGLAAADLASVTVFHRGLLDLAYDAVTGRNCSEVRLDRGQSWCARPVIVPPPGYCTRTLGDVECFTAPAPGVPAASLADGPGWLSEGKAPGTSAQLASAFALAVARPRP